jgi:hypothetical protein
MGVYMISGWNWLWWAGPYHPEYIEAALANGPMLAAFDVYQDFFSYKGGVYHHTWGDSVGGHAVAIVGYDSAERYWIVKNSWGANWGENGYFRIGFGECGIEDYVAVVSVGIRKSDLAIEKIWLESELGETLEGNMRPGERFYLWANLRNLGDATALGFQLFGSYDDSGPLWWMSALAPGELVSYHIGPLEAESGIHKVLWMVIPGDSTQELTEANNEKDYVFTADGPPLPQDHVIINELELDPPLGRDAWVELSNPTFATVDLSGWTVRSITGFTVTIPDGTLLESEEYYVAAFPQLYLLHNDRPVLSDRNGLEQDRTPEAGWTREYEAYLGGVLSDGAGDDYSWQRCPENLSTRCYMRWIYVPSTPGMINTIPSLPSSLDIVRFQYLVDVSKQETTIIQARLTPHIANRAVEFEASADTEHWITLGTSYTDSEGMATMTWLLTSEPPGVYHIRARWDGDAGYLGAVSNEAVVTLEWSLQPTSLSILFTPETVDIGTNPPGTVTITVLLSPPVSAKSIRVYQSKGSDQGPWNLIGTCLTDGSGQCSLSWQPSEAPWGYFLRAYFDGDASYLPSFVFSSNSVTVVPEFPNSPLHWILVVIVLLALLSVTRRSFEETSILGSCL